MYHWYVLCTYSSNIIVSIVKRGTSDPEELWCREARISAGAVHVVFVKCKGIIEYSHSYRVP